MKWRGRILFLLLSFSFVTAARSQLISFSVNKESLGKVFLLIEQQSGHHFIYSTEELLKAKPVTLAVTNEQLTAVLDKCFAGQPLQYSLHEKNITVKEKPVATAGRSLQGRVVNEQGEPVAGITIGIKNSSLLVSSYQDGGFKLENVPPAAVLLITGAEIEPFEIPAGFGSFVQITVRPRIGTLDETYIIAYGKSSRRYATGTVSSVKAGEISKQPVSNILSVLTGRVPGLQVTQVSGVPGSYIKLQLRGTNSIANGNDPLIVIDGIPFPSAPLNGSLGGGATVAASPLNSVNPSDIESVEILKDADATAIYGSRGANGVILITTKKAKAGKTSVNVRVATGAGKITRSLDLLSTPGYLSMRREAFANDGIVPTPSNARDLKLWDTTRFTDWQKVLIGKTMHTTDVQASVSGGSQQTQFLLNTGYHKETTVFPGDFGEVRKSVNLTTTHQSADSRFGITLAAGFSHYRNELPQQDLFSAITLAPNAPAIYTADGKLNWENSTWANPLARTQARFITNTENINGSMNTFYIILPGLQFRLNAGASTLHSRDHKPTPQAANNPTFGIPSSAGFGNKSIQTIIAEPQLGYERKLAKANASLLVGTTIQQTDERSLYQSGTGYASDDLLESLKAAAQVTTFSESDIEYRYVGFFARFKYELDKKYLLSLTGRRDGSSRYGEENRFSNFWSAGAGWIFSNEPWIKHWKWLSFGKLKASVGITGNDQIGDYKYLKLYTPALYPYLAVTPFFPAQQYNPVYGWEKVTKLEAGLDLGFLNNRFIVGANYYHNKTGNQLVSYPLPALTGFSGVLRNIPATIRNSGLEIEINATIFQRRKFSWQMVGNLTVPDNKLVAFQGLAASSYANLYVIGSPLNIVKTYQHLGLDPTTGTYIFRDYNSDGQVSSPADQQQVIFTGQQFYGGLQSNVTMGSFAVSFLLQFSRRNHAENYLYLFARPGVMQNQPQFVMDRWRKPGDITLVQRYAVSNAQANPAFGRYQQSGAAYSNASYIRLRNLVVSYDLLKARTNKKGIRQCLAFIEGHNLFTITRYKGLDPENSTQLVPPVRMLVAGFQITL